MSVATFFYVFQLIIDCFHCVVCVSSHHWDDDDEAQLIGTITNHPTPRCTKCCAWSRTFFRRQFQNPLSFSFLLQNSGFYYYDYCYYCLIVLTGILLRTVATYGGFSTMRKKRPGIISHEPTSEWVCSLVVFCFGILYQFNGSNVVVWGYRNKTTRNFII